MSTELAELPQQQLSEVKRTIESIDHIREFVAKTMRLDLDYGPIPGTDQKKKNLLLPGAQKALLYFNVRPEFTVNKIEIGNGHCEVDIKTVLVNRETNERVGEGLGSCCTMEGKYRFRNAERKCPACQAEAIRQFGAMLAAL